MHYVVDGYNFGHCAGLIGQDRKKDSSEIVRHVALSSAMANRGNEATIVFDGAGKKESLPRIDVVFSGREEADEVVKRVLESCARARRKNYAAVTDDRSLGAYCRSLGVQVLSVKKFLSITGRKRRSSCDNPSEKPVMISWEDIKLSKIFEQGFGPGNKGQKR